MSAVEKSLLRAWAVLMGLSLALALAEAIRPGEYRLVWITLVGAVAVWKARVVLANYLGLRRAPSALAGFTFAIVVIIAIVVSSFSLQALIANFA